MEGKTKLCPITANKSKLKANSNVHFCIRSVIQIMIIKEHAMHKSRTY